MTRLNDDERAELAPKRQATHSFRELLESNDPEATKRAWAQFLRMKLPVIIAVAMPFLITVFFILPNVILSDAGEKKVAAGGVQTKFVQNDEAPLIKETVEADAELIQRVAIPDFDANAAPDENDPTEFASATDSTFDPHATETGIKGIAEGDPKSLSELITASSGGKGLAGAIGIGAGSGPGSGGPKGRPTAGTRMNRRNEDVLKRPELEKPMMAGLAWLARHQSPDGSWDPVGFDALCESQKCSGRGSSIHTAGITGLALLTFLGAGYDSNRPSPYRDAIKKGLKWLRDNQDAEGCFGSRSNNRFTYSHACATLAMCEAYSSHRLSAWKQSAQNGLAFIGACQNPYKAWRYGVKPGDNDTSVTGWMLMALKAGDEAGLIVDKRSMMDGLDYINSMTDEETGRTGYVSRGGAPVRPEGRTDLWPAAESESLTAVAMCARIFCRRAEADASLMEAGAKLLSKKLPVWDEAGGKIDMYYWYYGTLAMFQIGGPRWEEWNRALKSVVIDHQVKDGCAAGSWDPKDAWSDDGGRIYSTALMTLCLEVYYRYPRVFGARSSNAK